MARQGRQPRQQQQQQSQANTSSKPKSAKASSAAKKKANASTSNSATALDVYSFQPQQKRARGDIDPQAKSSAKDNSAKKKRRRRSGSAQEDGDGDDDSEDDDEPVYGGDEIIDFTGVKPRGLKMGLESDDGGADEGVNDDEDIDSDEAAGDSSDETGSESEEGAERPRKKKTKSLRAPARASNEIDLDENEIDWDDEDGEGYMDLAEVLDTGAFASDDDGDDDEDEGESVTSEDQNGDQRMASDASDESDEDDDNEAGLDKLESFVNGLEGSHNNKRKSLDDDESDGEAGAGKKKKRVVLKERTEAYPEGEFVAIGSRGAAGNGKVNLDDLLSTFSDSKNPRLASLRKTLKPLAASSSATSSAPATGKSQAILKAAGPLAAPLPARLQDKLDREAAYEKTREETDKWNETVRRMKGASGLGVEGARHERLTLPLMGGAGDVRRDPNAAEWSAKFQPTNELEASIQSLLAAGQMSQADLQKAESAALATLDPADVAARQAELRQQRDLMYRAERKAKRVAKIKSKAYRRIHRKIKSKAGGLDDLSLEDLAEMDRADGGDRVAEQTARMEVLRAKERATLKHSASGKGRWSRTDIGGLEGLDAERNTAARDMAKRSEMLQRRIAGMGDQDDSAQDDYGSVGDESSDADGDDDRDVDDIKRDAMDELKSLEAKDRALALANGPKAKGVVGMKFMQDAIKRGERRAQADADALHSRLEQMGQRAEERDDGDEDSAAVAGMSEQVQGNLGRMVFGPGPGAAQTAAPVTSAPAATTAATQHSTKLSAPLVVPNARPSPLTPSAAGSGASSSNPWLDPDAASSAARISRKANKATTASDSRASRMADKVAKTKSKQLDAREAEKDDAAVDLDLSSAGLMMPAKEAPQIGNGSTKQSKANGGARPPAQADDSSDDDEKELDEEEIDAQRGKGPAAFKQRELVAAAFAGDNVVADFEAEKRRQVERDAPRIEDNTLPGWGAWGGKGAKKKKNAKKFVTAIPGIAPEQRKDAKFSNVIISEKKDKKATKYLLKDLPFPYTSAAQHEHKLRTPMGPEWSTSTILRDQTLPSVLIKPGVTIRPVDRKV